MDDIRHRGDVLGEVGFDRGELRELRELRVPDAPEDFKGSKCLCLDGFASETGRMVVYDFFG